MSNTVCPECGATLPAAFARRPCPSCLLQLGFGIPEANPAARESSYGGNDGESGISDALTYRRERSAGLSGEAPGAVVDRYKLLEVIGEGGFGTVWMAEQQEPVKRKVALKIIKPGMDTRQVVARFEAERQALALMDHANIARVFDGGATEGGRPYFVMELVRGVPLSAFCDARKLTTRERIELFIPVCQAVQHAHQKGVIHRDLKPTNILVTEQDGRAVPKVIDFGIAKATEADLTERTLFTRFNQTLGTPAYMSPEQAGLGGLDIDTRTDIYSLGVLLYELLTGRTPLEAQKCGNLRHEELLKTIRETEPPRPSTHLSALRRENLLSLASLRSEDPHQLCRLLRGDLDWIVLKALEKDRARRYESANGLAADLRRFLDNEPIAARAPSNLYRLQKLARRNQLLFGAVGAVSVAMVAGLIATTWQMVHARRNLALFRLNAYAAEMNLAQQAIAENNLERALQLLRNHENSELRGFEWRYLWQVCQENEIATFRDAPPRAFYECTVAFSTDGRFLAYGGSGRVVVREGKTYRRIKELLTSADAISFSPSNDLLVTSVVGPPSVKFWNTAGWTEVTIPKLTNVGSPAIFSPDGRWLATGAANGTKVQLWNTETWESVASCPASPILPIHDRSALAFSPDGKLLVTGWLDLASVEGGVRLWKMPTLENYTNLYEVPLLSATFLPRSGYLLAGSWWAQLQVWNVDAHPPKMITSEGGHSAYIPAIAVAPGAKTFATASADQSICLWDASTFRRVARWRGHTREVWALAMSPDGERIASSSPDGTIRLWHGQPHDTGETWDDAGYVAGFSSDGQTVVFGPSETDYHWRLVTGTNRVIIPIPESPPPQI